RRHARLSQRRRFRRVPGWRSAQIWHVTGRLGASQDRRSYGCRRGTGGGDTHLSGQGSWRWGLSGRHARAARGDGGIAGPTCDVAGHATLQVNVIKGLNIDGPILFPLEDDLPFLARAMSRRERESASDMAKSYGVKQLESNLPISFIGTGKDLNLAIDNGLQR